MINLKEKEINQMIGLVIFAIAGLIALDVKTEWQRNTILRLKDELKEIKQAKL